MHRAQVKQDVQEAYQQQLTFADGIPGFEQLHAFAWEETADDHPFGLLQSIDEPAISFVLVDPFLFFDTYSVDIPDMIVQELGIAQEDEMTVRTIVTFPEQTRHATTNLLAPLLIHLPSGQGKQLILHGSTYMTQHPLLPPSSKEAE